ncbi:54S ribosomal protein L12, mitochondrial, partial [Elasticomyces elasticus]
MSLPSQAAARCCRQLVRPSTTSSSLRLSSSTYLSQRIPGRRWESMQAEGAAASTNPKITQIVDQVSQLTLLETADLVSSLK